MPLVLNQPIRLLPTFRERVWGRDSLAPLFPDAPQGQRTGEVWYTFDENQTSLGISLGELLKSEPGVLGNAALPEYAGICPLLVKMLFTTERLSVQVHPDDNYAQKNHRSLGKTEAWYIVDAEPRAELAVGFRESISAEKLRESARSGEIERLLDWRPVKAGDVIYTPAGTVHAIGAGLTVCEIQENSDITYRLYDYGRNRELHLEHGLAVSHLGPHEQEMKVVKLAAWRDQLAESSYFRIERLRPINSITIERGVPFYLLLICLKGSGSLAGARVEPGQCWMIPADSGPIEMDAAGSEWILTYTADAPLEALHGQ